MADIVRTKAQIAVVFPSKAVIFSAVAGAAIEAGQPVYFDTTTKKVLLSDANGSGTTKIHGIALEDAAAGAAVGILKEGHVYGYTLSGDVGSFAYVSDTVGELADAAGTAVLPVGMVVPLTDVPTLTKVLYVDIPWAFRIVADT